MKRLTYANRGDMLRLIDGLKAEASPIADDELVRAVSAFVVVKARDLGFDLPLTRDAISLCYHLIVSPPGPVQETARAALLYLLKEDDVFPDAEPQVGLQDDYYVLGLAIHAISQLTGQSVCMSGLNLTDHHRSQIETMLQGYRLDPPLSDEYLYANIPSIVARIEAEDHAGTFARLTRGTMRLVDLLRTSTNPDVRSWCCAGLGYLCIDTDVIPDNLGLVGLLDDEYAVQVALRESGAQAGVSAETLDSIVHSWPFLHWLVLNDASVRVRVSDYLIANAGLVQVPSGPANTQCATGLRVPIRGPLPFFLALCSAFGLVMESCLQDIADTPFRRGDKVFVDSRSVVRIFGGLEDVHGRGMHIAMVDEYRHRGRQMARKLLVPATPEYLARLTPAPSDRATCGEIASDLTRSQVPMRAVDRILQGDAPAQLQNVGGTIVLVSGIAATRALADQIFAFGERLRDVIPIAHVDPDGELHCWSPLWSAIAPVIVVAQNAAVAAEAIESGAFSVPPRLVVIDAGTVVARQTEPLKRLSRLSQRYLIVADEAQDDAVLALHDAGVRFVDWTRDDLKDLDWPHERVNVHSSVIRLFELRTELIAHSTVVPRMAICPEADNAFSALRSLNDLVAAQHEQSSEFDPMLNLGYRVLTSLLECVVPLDAVPSFSDKLSAWIEQLRDMSSSMYLPPSVANSIDGLSTSLGVLFASMATRNVKAEALKQLLTQLGPSLLVVRSRSRNPELERAVRDTFDRIADLQLVSLSKAAQSVHNAPMVVAGWLNKINMRNLLCPPLVSQTILLLHNAEAQAYYAFEMQRKAVRRRALATTASQHLRNRTVAHPHDTTVSIEPPVDPTLDALRARLSAYRRSLSLRDALPTFNDPGVFAKTFWFSGGRRAFLSGQYRAKSVSHLVGMHHDDAGQGPPPEVELVERDDLTIGDYVLFHEGLDSNAIRVVADRLLGSPAVRTRALRWRRALDEFRTARGWTTFQVAQHLRGEGCRRHSSTIMHWLEDDELTAPRAYEDVDLIATVTEHAELARHLDDCKAAISDVRGAHLRASQHLATEVMNAFARRTAASHGAGAASDGLELGNAVVVVRIEQIDDEFVEVRRSLCNQLLETPDDDQDAP